jgi:pantoate--beta-alanine ligase
MRTVKTIRSLRPLIARARARHHTVGFVPTMGALHEGHLSLIRRCRRENDLTVVSIFVNPQQFGPREDFAAYPRPEKKDKVLAKKEKVDIIFYPSGNEMYPSGFLTSVVVARLTEGLCGASRPGHFRGVTTVVGKLLNIVAPDRLYLGQKDAQQVAVLQRMVRDLDFPVAVKVCPTVREPDGLALSSRNLSLSAAHRREAPVLFRSLTHAKEEIRSGERRASLVVRRIRKTIERQSSGRIDYIACVDADSLLPLEQLTGKVLIALAVTFGRTRLIDNIRIRIP